MSKLWIFYKNPLTRKAFLAILEGQKSKVFLSRGPSLDTVIMAPPIYKYVRVVAPV